MMVTLGIAGMFSGLAIVGIFLVTQPMIERNRAEALEAAIYRVLEGARSRVAFVIREGKLARFESPDGSLPKEEAVYAGYDEAGALLGFAVPAEGPGFQDTIKLLYGYNLEKQRVVGMEVLESRETPGLGDKIIKDAEFVGNFRDLAVEPDIVAVKGGGAGRTRSTRSAGPPSPPSPSATSSTRRISAGSSASPTAEGVAKSGNGSSPEAAASDGAGSGGID